MMFNVYTRYCELAAELKNPSAVTSEQHVDRDIFGSLVVNKSLSNNQTGLVANIRRVPSMWKYLISNESTRLHQL
jgi:uncharacterized protein YueI